MTKTNKDAPAIADTAADVLADVEQVVAGEQDLTLTEFCQRLSKQDKRVELISAFHYSENAAGKIKDVESAFAGRFADFINKPA